MEQEYKAPIEISANDPICSVSGIEGAVIGILFDKTGAEIDQALSSRLTVVAKELERYNSVVGTATDFLQKKKKEVEKLEKIYNKRIEEKTAQAKPFERKIRDIHKEWNDKAFEFDKVTEKEIAGEAVGFEKGFDDFEENFKKIDLLVEEQEEEQETSRSLHMIRSKGLTKSSSSSSCSTSSSFSTPTAAAYMVNGVNEICEAEDEQAMLRISTNEDKALARLSNLKQLLVKYIYKVKMLSGKVNDLKAEERRLSLIKRNLNAERTYKLDLNKLSAFGFEDLKLN